MIQTAIICEYNPFHNGHLRQLEFIHARFGGDAVITAIMSGNFVQRGDFAAAPKYERAAAAVKCGCDLVLELPYPWSCSSAEFFASAGVSLANSLGVFDTLCFGCESSAVITDIIPVEPLCYTDEEITVINRFREYLARREIIIPTAKPERLRNASKLRETEAAYRDCYGETVFYPTSANDILGVEYIAALDRLNSKIIPIPLPRVRGLSATASRAAWERGDFAALDRLVPAPTSAMCVECDKPVAVERLGVGLPLFFRLANPAELERCCDADGGLARRLCAASQKSFLPSELFAHTAAKHLTSARIRRAALYCLFSTIYSEVEAAPAFTAVLAANRRGTALLREINEKKKSQLTVITKPADYKKLEKDARLAFEKSLRADGVFMLACGKKCDPLTLTPYIDLS
jgi:Predicted nucleotidyltransferase